MKAKKRKGDYRNETKIRVRKRERQMQAVILVVIYICPLSLLHLLFLLRLLFSIFRPFIFYSYLLSLNDRVPRVFDESKSIIYMYIYNFFFYFLIRLPFTIRSSIIYHTMKYLISCI